MSIIASTSVKITGAIENQQRRSSRAGMPSGPVELDSSKAFNVFNTESNSAVTTVFGKSWMSTLAGVNSLFCEGGSFDLFSQVSARVH